jgi:hypothetical protein
MASKDELTEFAIHVLDMACEVLGCDNPLDREEEEE